MCISSDVISSTFKYSTHFYNLGWTDERCSGDIFWFPKCQMEAIKIECNGINIDYSVLAKDNVWYSSDSQGVAGTTGKSIALYAIKLSINDDVTSSEAYEIWYRVFLQNDGWTSFCKNGEICGNSLIENGKVIEGIQIVFCSQKQKSSCLSEAEIALDNYKKIIAHCCVRNKPSFLRAITQNYFIPSKTEVHELKDGVILPLVKIASNSRNGQFKGGVVDSEGKFVAGLDRKLGKRMNFACIEGYEVKNENLKVCDETVIFGGIVIGHFGHMMTESLSRFWYIVENEQSQLPIILLTVPGEEKFTLKFFEIMGVDIKRIRIVDQPTKFQKIIVPDESLHLWAGHKDKACVVYEKMMQNCIQKGYASYKKIFLTRTALPKKDAVNEEFFDQFFSRHGYKVLSPEKYSLDEQIAILAQADEVICTEGTLSHLALFCRPHTKFVIFRRDDTSILPPQLIINQAKQLDIYYVDATYNFLPTKHAHGQSLYGPTQYFVDFLNENNIEYSDEEVEFDLSRYCYQYLIQWCNNYNSPKNFYEISEQDMFDVISRMNRILGKEPISRRKFVSKIRQKQQSLIQENTALKKRVKAMESGKYST